MSNVEHALNTSARRDTAFASPANMVDWLCTSRSRTLDLSWSNVLDLDVTWQQPVRAESS